MGIPLAMFQSMGKDISTFGIVQMHCPAAGIMLAKLIVEKNNNLLPKRFFKGFVILSFAIIISSLTNFYAMSAGFRFLNILGPAAMLILYLLEDDEKLDAYGLKPKNWKLSRSIILLFIILYFLSIILPSIFDGKITQIFELFSAELLGNLLFILPLMAITSFASTFGEEYGWRCYFQPLLQKKFGLIKGVFIFGMLWGLWHMPLNFFHYAPKTPLISMLAQQIACISLGVFFAFAYMKTGNIWVIVMLHLLYNGLGYTIGSMDSADTVSPEYTVEMIDIAIFSVINFAIFLPFLFSKVFKKTPIKIE